MTGILNAATEAVYSAPDGVNWTYFQDADTPEVYYIVQQPGIHVANGQPLFHLTEYTDPSGVFQSAMCQITTALQSPPASVRAAIEAALKGRGVASPLYQAMPYFTPDSLAQQNLAYLSYADATGVVSASHAVVPSLSGDQQAQFSLDDLTQTEVAFFKDYFGGVAGAGTVTVSYQLTVMAHMQGVTATVSFESQKAYDYQRTFKWVS